MALSESFWESTTTYCSRSPSTASIATSYCGSVSIMSATSPWIVPRRVARGGFFARGHDGPHALLIAFQALFQFEQGAEARALAGEPVLRFVRVRSRAFFSLPAPVPAGPRPVRALPGPRFLRDGDLLEFPLFFSEAAR